MLAYDFDYYLPDTVQEAVDIYNTIQSMGKKPFYYGGGTEIISMGRVFNIIPDAVIDIKKIPECCEYGTDGNKLYFGSAITLSMISESNLYPLLGLAAGRIADHTIQCRLTLGGNLAGTIRYQETLLPLMLADATLHTTGPRGTSTTSITETLSSGSKLSEGELIIKVSMDKKYASLLYAHIKKSKSEKIGYPLISLSAVYKQGSLCLAASGLCDNPLRFEDIPINNSQRASDITKNLRMSIPLNILDDIEGSAEYRIFIFEKTVEKIINDFRKDL